MGQVRNYIKNTYIHGSIYILHTHQETEHKEKRTISMQFIEQ